jgi:4-amino-4-deoxy-L-arabinose transferase-like glycosyltransferase
MQMTSTAIPSYRAAWHRWAALGILVVALATRVYRLADQGLWLDELHSLEGAYGHGCDHQLLPTGHVLARPIAFTRPDSARSLWAVWAGLDRVSHPPGWYLELRLWADVFGTSEVAVRSLAVVASVAAVAAVMLAVRSWAGPEPALWAGTLMAVAGPQVRAAQGGRPYAQLMLLSGLALWAVGKTVRQGPSRRRSAGLACVVLAMLLTHYFSVAPLAAVGTYALLATRGRTRRHLLAALAMAGLVFALAWGPFMLRQLATFSTADRSAAFLVEPVPDHFARTAFRLLTLPAVLTVDRQPIPLAYGAVGLLAYLAAGTLTARRWWRGGPRGDLMGLWPGIWPMWFVAIVGLLAALDFTRSTMHLGYTRYPLLAAPVVYAAMATGGGALNRTAGRVLAACAIGWAAWSLPLAYVPLHDDFDSFTLAGVLRAPVSAGDPIVLAGLGTHYYATQNLYLALSHYDGPPAGPVLLLDRPATAAAVAGLGRRSVVWMLAEPGIGFVTDWLPGYHATAGQALPRVGQLVRFERDADPSPMHQPTTVRVAPRAEPTL